MSENRFVPSLNLSGIQKYQDDQKSNIQGFMSERISYPQPDMKQGGTNSARIRRKSTTAVLPQFQQPTNPHEYILQKIGFGEVNQSKQNQKKIAGIGNFKSKLQSLIQSCKDHKQICKNQEQLLRYNHQQQIQEILAEDQFYQRQCLVKRSNKILSELQRKYGVLVNRIHCQFEGQSFCVEEENHEDFLKMITLCLQMEHLPNIQYNEIVEFYNRVIKYYKKEQKLYDLSQKVQNELFEFKKNLEKVVPDQQN